MDTDRHCGDASESYPVIRAGRFIIGRSGALCAWAGNRLGVSFDERHTAVGILSGDTIIAVVAYSPVYFDHNREPWMVEMSVAADSPAWATPHSLRFVFAWPFTCLGVRRAQARVSVNNPRSLRFCRGIGYEEEGRMVDGYPGPGGGDAILFGMTPGSCRWLKESSNE